MTDGIKPNPANGYYWEYLGNPIVLIGGSDDDNIFQWSRDIGRLTEHLDVLKAAGGNYIRNTMSSRNKPFPYNDESMAYPFRRLENGKYDLDNWDEEYWRRLRVLLEETARREIIVQQEPWDAYTVVGRDAWGKQPWNPDNNINYTYEDTTLSAQWQYPPPFFAAVPQMKNDPILLHYQTRYISKMMAICLEFDHVLYQLDNESIFPFEVSDFWAAFIHAEASPRRVYVCDSRRFHGPGPGGDFTRFRDSSHPEHRHVLSRPMLYNYTDISQNGGHQGQSHYDNLLWFRRQLLPSPRPINHTKTYQFIWPMGQNYNDSVDGGAKEGADRFWRSVYGGAASVRHHRHVPPVKGPRSSDSAVDF